MAKTPMRGLSDSANSRPQVHDVSWPMEASYDPPQHAFFTANKRAGNAFRISGPSFSTELPAACLQQLGFLKGRGCQPLHRAGYLFADLGENLGLIEVGGGNHDRPRARHRLVTLLGVV